MAIELPLFYLPAVQANADLSSNQFYCVKQTATDFRVGLTTVQGEPFDGILQNKPSAAGDAATVMAAGVSKVVAGEALTAGDRWKCGADGKAYKADVSTTGADVGEFVAGRVLEAAASGAIATVTIGLASGVEAV